MNGFKLGLHAQDFYASKYIVPLSTTSFKPCTKSTIFFPPSYAKLYSSLSAGVPGALQSSFNITRSFDSATKVTILTAEMKA